MQKQQSINLTYLDLMTDGDQEMKKTMLEMLLQELEPELKKMRELLDAENYEELHPVSHKMKSTLAFVGNDDMTEANTQIEYQTKHQTAIDQLPELMQRLENSAPSVLSELRQALAQLS